MINFTDGEYSRPIGLDFLEILAAHENTCELETRRRLPDMGDRIPACLQELGTVLSLFDGIASCHWGCNNGNHIVERLAGRVYSCSRAALRLSMFGLYDESLAVTRGIYEIANLLFLFNCDANELVQWEQLTDQKRKSHFKPFRVRDRLVLLKAPLPINETRYGMFCELFTHPTPKTKPQSHNMTGAAGIRSEFQEGGLILALNELAGATALAIIPLPKLLNYDSALRSSIKNAGLVLLKSIGSVNIETIQSMFNKLWQYSEDRLCKDDGHESEVS